MPARHHALAAACLTLAATAARSDAPLVSETADVIPDQACQVEMATGRSRASGLPATTGQDVLGSCGVAGKHQLALGYARERGEGQTAHALRAFVKTTLLAPEAGSNGYGLRYGFDANRMPGSGWRSEGLEVLGVLTRELAPSLLLHANIGHAWSRSARQGTTLWSLGVETATDTTFAADVFGDDRSRPWASAGIGTKLGRGLSVNASVAVQFESPRVTQWTLGAKIEF